jgi:hypothetical protein
MSNRKSHPFEDWALAEMQMALWESGHQLMPVPGGWWVKKKGRPPYFVFQDKEPRHPALNPVLAEYRVSVNSAREILYLDAKLFSMVSPRLKQQGIQHQTLK